MSCLTSFNPYHRIFRNTGRSVCLALLALVLPFCVLAVDETSAQSYPMATVSAPMANVYAQPSLNAQMILSLQQGAQVPLLGWRIADYRWVMIGVQQQHGWIQAHHIDSDFPLANLVEGTGPSAAPPVLRPNVPVGGRSTIPSAVVTSYALNVRSGPSIDHTVIAKVPRDYLLELAGRNASATWAEVSLQNGRSGWVRIRYIRIIDGFPISSLPVTTRVDVPVGGRQMTHVVQAGENLFRIALRYGVDLNTLARVNGIQNPALIYAGQTLIIPS